MEYIIISSTVSFALAIITKLLLLMFDSSLDRASLYSVCSKIYLVMTPVALYFFGGIQDDATWVSTITSLSLSLLIYACLYVLYTPFYYTISHSLSIRIIRRLLQTKNGSLTPAKVRAPFLSRDFLEARLNSMSKNGYLICEYRKYRLSNRGQKIAILSAALKQLWKLGPGG